MILKVWEGIHGVGKRKVTTSHYKVSRIHGNYVNINNIEIEQPIGSLANDKSKCRCF